jgi:hypothetical protein
VTYVTYGDAEPSGLASILGGLIEQNLQREPARERLLRPAIVAISAPDAEVEVTLIIHRGSVAISDGRSPKTQLTVEADTNRLLAITATPLRFGYPDALREEGRALIADIFSARVRLKGVVGHPFRLRRLTLLLSVA